MGEVSVGEFMEELKVFDKNARLSFSGLDFYRLKMRGDDLIQVEFNQQVYKDSNGKVIVENLE